MIAEGVVWDLIVVGAGPAGAVVAAEAVSVGQKCLLLDRGTVGEGIALWPHRMRFFSTTDKVELPGMALITLDDKPTREEYLAYLRRYVRERIPDFRAFHEVEEIQPERQGAFRVLGRDRWKRPFMERARAVVMATGAFEQPHMLGCPGEELPHVRHFFEEVHPYALHRVAIVGGSSSAVETALLLWRAGAKVTLIHRGPRLRPVKFWLAPDIENRIQAGEIFAHFESRVTRITEDGLEIQSPDGLRWLEIDYVLALTGYGPDVEILRRAGAEIDPSRRKVTVNPETLETTVPGLFLAGVLIAGNMSGDIFIENSRDHGRKILRALASR